MIKKYFDILNIVLHSAHDIVLRSFSLYPWPSEKFQLTITTKNYEKDPDSQYGIANLDSV